MWQLMLNGLSLLSSGVGLYSSARGFSAEKNVEQIQQSLKRIEGLHDQLLDASRVSRTIIEGVAPLLSDFSQLKNPAQQVLSAATLEQIVRSINREETEATRAILAASMAEIRTVLDSFRLAQSPTFPAPANILQELLEDPYEAGITSLWDISESGLWTPEQPQLANRVFTPITWSHPKTGQTFLGKMPISRLQRFGLNQQPLSYPHTIDGLVFSDRYGLYVPSYLALVL